MIEAYPLCWPLGYERTPKAEKKHAPFKTSFASARDQAIRELEMMGADNIIISTNIPLRKDGLPYSVPFGSVTITDDTGIAVYFDFIEETKVLCCDAWLTLDDNMQAITKTIEALRGIDRWKVSDMLNRTFTGFKAIAEKSEVNKRPWWEVLWCPQGAGPEIIKFKYRELAKKLHPDAGGTAQAFQELQEAYEQALQSNGI